MSTKSTNSYQCAVCEKSFSRNEIVPSVLVQDPISELIGKEHSSWSSEKFICRPDLAKYRMQYVHSLLESEKGELTSLEQDVLKSIRDHELLSANIDRDSQQEWTFGERLADKIAMFGGSWRFLIIFGIFLVIWIIINSLAFLWKPADPYPFILLNLILSCLAAIQAPVIMMSQNRQEAKDRARSEHDYQVNLKAELEIRHLNDKVDHLLSQQWDRLVKIQELQIELLEELNAKKTKS